MRLVSAIWADYHPFVTLNAVNSTFCTEDPDEMQRSDILVSQGGGDIHPRLYNKGRSRFSGAYEMPSNRDRAEWALMKRAVELDIPIIGICRGAQMLCALAGGYLIQHVNNHGGRHFVMTNDNQAFQVNSIQHQMLYPFDVEHEMVAWCPSQLSDVHYDVDTDVQIPVEPEFVYFPQIKGYAIQWHPEMMDAATPANVYVLNFINQRVKETVNENNPAAV